MAKGDVVIFEEAMATLIEGGWAPTDVIKCAILDDTTTPAADDATPALGDYTEVGTGGRMWRGGPPWELWRNVYRKRPGP